MVAQRPLLTIVIAVAMVAGGIVVGAVLTWVILTRSFVFGGTGDAIADQPAPTSFSINGDLDEPFSPGGSAPLDLTIANPLDTDLIVTGLLVEVEGVDAPNSTVERPCGVDDFAVEQFAGRDVLVVAAGSSVSLTDLGVSTENLPQVLMFDTSTNQDGCKGASFALAYSAEGRIVE